MLVLTRKKGEVLVIGEDIEVSIVDVRGDSVRIGIEAPRSVSIWRKELIEEIARENRKALEESPSQELLEGLLKFRVSPKADGKEKPSP